MQYDHYVFSIRQPLGDGISAIQFKFFLKSFFKYSLHKEQMTQLVFSFVYLTIFIHLVLKSLFTGNEKTGTTSCLEQFEKQPTPQHMLTILYFHKNKFKIIQYCSDCYSYSKPHTELAFSFFSEKCGILGRLLGLAIIISNNNSLAIFTVRGLQKCIFFLNCKLRLNYINNSRYQV